MSPNSRQQGRDSSVITSPTRRKLSRRQEQRRTLYLMEALERRTLLSIDFAMAGNNLKSKIDAVQSSVHNAFDAANSIPVLGSDIQNPLGALNSIVSSMDSIGSALNSVTSIATIQEKLFSGIGSFLGDTNASGIADKNDIIVTPGPSESSVDIRVLLKKTVGNNTGPFGPS